MHWQKPDREAIGRKRAYVQGESDKMYSIEQHGDRWVAIWNFNHTDLGDRLVCYIPGPPPEGMTEAWPVVVKCKDKRREGKDSERLLVTHDGFALITDRFMLPILHFNNGDMEWLRENFEFADADLAKLPAWVRDGIK